MSDSESDEEPIPLTEEMNWRHSLGTWNILVSPPGGILTAERVRHLLDVLPKIDPEWERSIHAPCCEGGIGFFTQNMEIGRSNSRLFPNSIMHFRFWNSYIGSFLSQKAGLDVYTMDQKTYEDHWEIIPEEYMRYRIKPESHTNFCPTLYRESEKYGLTYGLKGWDEWKQYRDLPYDVFYISPVEGASFKMVMSVYKALKITGFKILATEGFQNGVMDPIPDAEKCNFTGNEMQWYTKLTFKEFKTFMKSQKDRVKNIILEYVDEPIANLIVSLAGCYSETRGLEAHELFDDKEHSLVRVGLTRKEAMEHVEERKRIGLQSSYKDLLAWANRHPVEWKRKRRKPFEWKKSKRMKLE